MFGGRIPFGGIIFYQDAILRLSDCAVEARKYGVKTGNRSSVKFPPNKIVPNEELKRFD